MKLRLLAATVAAALSVPSSSFLAPGLGSTQDPSLSTATFDGPWIGPGPYHKVFIDLADASPLVELHARGAVHAEFDYGSFAVAIVDEAAYGGRAALSKAGLDIRDEQDLIPLSGYLLDGSRPLDTLATLDPNERWGDLSSSALDANSELYIVQFAAPVQDAWLAELEQIGIDFLQFTPANAYVIKIAPERVWMLENLRAVQPAIQFVGEYHPAFRMTPSIRAAAQTESGLPRRVTVQLIDSDGVRNALELVRAMSHVPATYFKSGPYVNVQAELDPAVFQELAHHPYVFAIEDRGFVSRNDERQGQILAGNLSGNSPSGPNYLSWLASMGFNSSQFGSFSVNVVDDATTVAGHPDIPNSRVDFGLNPTGQSSSQGGHGFLNAHIVAGFNNQSGSTYEDGGGYNYGLGIAPWAHVGATAIFGSGGLNPTSFENSAYQNGARISSNSWSFIDGNQNPIPDYDSSSQTYDNITRDARGSVSGNQEYLVLFAAGNDGPTTNTISTPSTAKNIITVGASENVRTTGTDGCGVSNSGANSANDIISFSSKGPVNSSGGDGRWKPEVVGPGTHIQAGIPQSNYVGGSVCNQFWPAGSTLYGWSSGTSHSTPALAGGAALVYQWFLNQGMGAPTPAMMKAVLSGTAEYMTGVGAGDTLPSNTQGLGRMNVGRAFDTTPKLYVDQSVVLGSTGATHIEAGTVADTGEPFRVILAWTDDAGSTTGAPWVNDLDLTVNVGGNTYRGNVFSGANSTTGGSADFRNNTESVFLPAGTGGSFTVTVTGSSIGGDGVPGNGDGSDQDFALYIYNGQTGGGGPIALFNGSPTTGIAPLNVSFTDQSTGGPTSWSWDFGDGGSSSSQNPNHTYNNPGLYTVTLTISAPGGNDTEVRTDYIVVSAPPTPGITDGSFEMQSPGASPASPWDIAFGSGHVVSPSGVSSDSGFPSHGTQWCEIVADSTDGATPPSNPGGVTSPPVGGAGVEQTFSFAAGETILSFEASFLRNENANETQYNDWMSVDITDGSTTYNLFYADTFSSTSGSSSKYGYPTTPIQTVSIDLLSIFPSATTATSFTVTAVVGNGDDDFQPSVGYVDNFALEAPVGVPVADFSGTPTSGNNPLFVNFTDLSTGNVTGWIWDFGDGNSSTFQNPNHTYTTAGTYFVSLTVTGPNGNDTEFKAGYITVNEPAPVADFSGTPTSGNNPLFVNFTDLSTGNVTGWSWDFGDGNSSTFQNPNHTYTTAGTYFVSLTATGPGGNDTELKTGYITVSEPAPVAEFSGTPTSGTNPLLVNFTDLSTGPVTSWSWDFGDGNTSTLQNPSHTYTTAGTFFVSLTATGPGGNDTELKTGYITVSEPAPVAEFSGTPTSGTNPLLVNFTDLSTGPVTSWSWDFGDGNTSTSQNPSHTYTTAGTFFVSLTATGTGGNDTELKAGYITVSEPAPVAEFSGTPTSGTNPLLVNFTDLSTGPVTSWSWDFGDGNTSTLQNPSHTYTTAGTFTVQLTATGPGGSDGETKVAYVTVNEPAPVAEFSGTPTSGTNPLLVNFTDLSTGPVTSWSWDFGDGNTSTSQNPSHTYTTAGTFFVSLTATGPGGNDTELKAGYITVSEPAPVAEFSGTPTSGTNPLLVNFTDLSTGPVTSWSWDFGDGNTSTSQNPSHTYTTAGTFTVQLTATGPGGSDGETKVAYVTVSEPAPVAEFSGTPTSGTNPLLVNFTDLSTGPVTSWSWDFGDGNTSTLQNPSHTYTTAGTFTVQLTATGPGGSDGEIKVAYVTVGEPAPVAEFSGTPTSGTTPLLVNFTDLSTGPVTSWSWDFGDGNTSTAQNPSHTYMTSGTFFVSLTATGPGGNDTELKAGYITVNEPAPVAEFSGTPTSGTNPLLVDFTDLSTGGPITSWSWDFGDGNTSTLQNPSHTYTTAASFTVQLTVTGPGGSDAETKVGYVDVMNIPAPVAEFSGSPLSGTGSLLVDFTDLSTGNVTSWNWTFGDGGSSTLQNPSHTYATPGSYTVILTATGPGGSDAETKTGYVNVAAPAPIADFSGTPTGGLVPLTVDFTDLSANTGAATSWSWDFGDGGSSNLQNPSHTYTAEGSYTVTLTVVDPAGTDSETKVDYVVAELVSIYCTAKVNSQGCLPQVAASGVPSASDPNPFDVSASMVLNQRNGLLFYGVGGRANIPFFGGTLCVQPALRRLGVQNAGGTLPPTIDCSGTYSFDFNALIQSGADPLLTPGQQVNTQYWSRDPLQADGTGVGLTNAAEFQIQN